MDDWTSSAPDQLAVNEPATNHPRTMTAPLTRPAPSWMTNIEASLAQATLKSSSHRVRDARDGPRRAGVRADRGGGCPRARRPRALGPAQGRACSLD